MPQLKTLVIYPQLTVYTGVWAQLCIPLYMHFQKTLEFCQQTFVQLISLTFQDPVIPMLSFSSEIRYNKHLYIHLFVSSCWAYMTEHGLQIDCTFFVHQFYFSDLHFENERSQQFPVKSLLFNSHKQSSNKRPLLKSDLSNGLILTLGASMTKTDNTCTWVQACRCPICRPYLSMPPPPPKSSHHDLLQPLFTLALLAYPINTQMHCTIITKHPVFALLAKDLVVFC